MPPTECSVGDCHKRVAARGLCDKHYWRLRVKGDVNYEYHRPTPEERFWKFVGEPDDPAECWEWLGTRMKNGYGRLGVYPVGMVLAHRFAWEMAFGPIPDGLCIDHLCRNRACANPNHLDAVTMRENLLRGEGFSAKNAAKTHCVNGHPFNEENTRINPDGRRGCRACDRESHQRRARI